MLVMEGGRHAGMRKTAHPQAGRGAASGRGWVLLDPSFPSGHWPAVFSARLASVTLCGHVLRRADYSRHTSFLPQWASLPQWAAKEWVCVSYMHGGAVVAES